MPAILADALPALVLVALAASVASVVIHAHRLAFLTVGVAHASLAGAGLAALLGVSLLGGAFVVAIALALAFAALGRGTTPDATSGILFAVGMAAGVVMLHLAHTQSAFFGLLFGDILAVAPGERLALQLGAIAMLGLFAAFGRLWWAMAADPVAAEGEGMPVGAGKALAYAYAAAAAMLCVKAAGIALGIGLLTLPAAIAWPWARGLCSAAAIASLSGTIGAVLGLFASWWWDWPTGPAIVLALFALFLLSRAAARAA